MMSADTSHITKVSQLAQLNPSAGSLYLIFHPQQTTELVESNLEAYSTPLSKFNVCNNTAPLQSRTPLF